MCDNPRKRSRSNVHALAVRISDVYKDWHKNMGPSLEAFPLEHLPIVRAVLCRYRFLRSTKPTDKTANLGVQMATEIKDLWGKACIPTLEHKHIYQAVMGCIDMWVRTLKRPK